MALKICAYVFSAKEDNPRIQERRDNPLILRSILTYH